MRRRCCCKQCVASFYYLQENCDFEDPEADFNCCTISFFDTSTGPIESWEWDFGDGVTSSEQNPIHHFFNNGLVPYTVSLTVTKTDGSICITEEEIFINCTHIWCSACKNIEDPFEANGTGKFLPYYLFFNCESAIGCYPTEATDCCSDNFHYMIGGGWVLVRNYDGSCVWCSDEFGHCVISAIDPDVYWTGQWCARFGSNPCPTGTAPSIEVFFRYRSRNVSDDSLISTNEASLSNIYFPVSPGVYSAGKYDCQNLSLTGGVFYAATCDFSSAGNRAFLGPGCAINPGPFCNIPDNTAPWAHSASLSW